MKNKFTLTTFLIIASSFTFGQNIDLENFEKYRKSILKVHLEGSNYDDNRDYKVPSFQKSRNISQIPELKSTQNIKQKLDSLLDVEYDEIAGQWINTYKKEFSYNANGDLIQLIASYWITVTSNWIQNYKYEHSFDTNRNRIKDIIFRWEISTSNWTPSDKTEYSYDAIGNTIQLTNSKWNTEVGNWTPSEKHDWIYDAKGNNILHTSSEWDTIISSWLPVYKNEMTYDINGNSSLDIASIWETGTSAWKASNKYENTYDTEGNRILSITSVWETSTNTWEDRNKYEINYDTIGNRIQDTYSKWDLNNNIWVIIHSDKLTYDLKGNIIKKYIYDRTVSTYNAEEEIEFSYDENGNLVKEIYRLVQGESDMYPYPEYKIETSYNNLIASDQLIIPPYYVVSVLADAEVYPEKHMIISYVEYIGPSQWSSEDVEDSVWVIYSSGKLYYSELNITGIIDISSGVIKIYPNPTSEFIMVDLSSRTQSALIELFDMQGRKLMLKEISGNEKVSLEGLKSGMYLYKLNVNGKVQNGKLVKK